MNFKSTCHFCGRYIGQQERGIESKVLPGTSDPVYFHAKCESRKENATYEIGAKACDAYTKVGFSVDERATKIDILDGMYALFEDGRVYSYYLGRYLHPRINADGYLFITTYSKQKTKIYSIHLLVAKQFIPNPENHPVVNHKDGNKCNPHKSNLEWSTHKDNSQHGVEIGLTVSIKNARTTSKKVVQYDLDGNFIKEYPSAAEAGRVLGLSRAIIGECCKGGTMRKECPDAERKWAPRKSYHGFVFQWKADEESVYNKLAAAQKEATAYATKLVEAGAALENLAGKHYEAKELLNEVFCKHESGLLPDRFIYEKIKTFLYGE